MAKLIKGTNDLATLFPHLLEEWDYSLNEKDPSEYMPGSSYEAWWICSKCGEKWQGRISHRTHDNRSCPYCAKRKPIVGKTDLETQRPDIEAEWDKEKNGLLSPKDFRTNSTKTVFWRCKYGHSYKTSIKNRCIRNLNCPICSGHQILEGYNDLATLRPDLAEEWHPTLNGELTPKKVGLGSHKKVYWLCNRGHTYASQIKSRVYGTGCPECDKERQTSFPEQAILYYLSKQFKTESRYIFGSFEIDIYLPELKIGIEYDGIHFHNSEKALRKEVRKNEFLKQNNIRLIRIKEIERKQQSFYKNDTIYYSYINSTYSNLDAPINLLFRLIDYNPNFTVNIKNDSVKIRSNYLSIEKQNSIASRYPHLLKEWDYEKNEGINPEFISYCSNKNLFWKCLKGHSYQTSPSHRIRGHGCPICSGHRVEAGFSDIATTHPELLSEWDYEKNTIFPTEVSFGSEKKVFWKCPQGHSYSMMVGSRANGSGCPICSGHQILKGFNDLATTNPEVLEEWDYEKNTILPSQISKGSQLKVFWKCKKCNYSYETSITNRVKGRKCPLCAGKVVVKGVNDFESRYPEIAVDWHPTLNSKKPFEVTSRNSKSFYWKCHICGHEWKNSIWNRTSGQGCPNCKKQNKN